MPASPVLGGEVGPLDRIAVIPARGGSKRIPRKNARLFLEKPMLTWAIDAVRDSGLFDRIVVSTDDAAIATLARDAGVEVPFDRPATLADDATSTDDVLLHAVAECVRIYGPFRQGCCVYPAAPLLRADDLARGLALLEEHHAATAFPVVAYDFPIEQAFTLDGVRPRPRYPEQLASRSQDLPTHYHDAGLFYWFDVARFVAARRLFCDDSVAFALPADRCQDINTPEDWARAELKVRLLRAATER